MTQKEIIAAAVHGESLGAMPMPDELLYERIRNITMLYNAEEIDKPQATQLKIVATQAHKRDCVQWRNGVDALMNIHKLYQQIELSATEYIKHKTAENAVNCLDKVLEVLYGLVYKGGDKN